MSRITISLPDNDLNGFSLKPPVDNSYTTSEIKPCTTVYKCEGIDYITGIKPEDYGHTETDAHAYKFIGVSVNSPSKYVPGVDIYKWDFTTDVQKSIFTAVISESKASTGYGFSKLLDDGGGGYTANIEYRKGVIRNKNGIVILELVADNTKEFESEDYINYNKYNYEYKNSPQKNTFIVGLKFSGYRNQFDISKIIFAPFIVRGLLVDYYNKIVNAKNIYEANPNIESPEKKLISDLVNGLKTGPDDIFEVEIKDHIKKNIGLLSGIEETIDIQSKCKAYGLTTCNSDEISKLQDACKSVEIKNVDPLFCNYSKVDFNRNCIRAGIDTSICNDKMLYDFNIECDAAKIPRTTCTSNDLIKIKEDEALKLQQDTFNLLKASEIGKAKTQEEMLNVAKSLVAPPSEEKEEEKEEEENNNSNTPKKSDSDLKTYLIIGGVLLLLFIIIKAVKYFINKPNKSSIQKTVEGGGIFNFNFKFNINIVLIILLCLFYLLSFNYIYHKLKESFVSEAEIYSEKIKQFINNEYTNFLKKETIYPLMSNTQYIDDFLIKIYKEPNVKKLYQDIIDNKDINNLLAEYRTKYNDDRGFLIIRYNFILELIIKLIDDNFRSLQYGYLVKYHNQTKQ